MSVPDGPAGPPLLRVLAGLYGGVVALRNRYYDRHGPRATAPVPVVSVGNLTVGGTGKTPLVAWLAAGLDSRGLRPAIVSRGYGGRAGRGPRVVSGGPGSACTAEDCGDEPLLLARRLPGVPVVVGSDRRAGAIVAAAAGSRVVILDDGFQHRQLARDLDIVLLDATDPFGNGQLLPAGRLREPLRGLARADLVLLTRSARGLDLVALEQVVRQHNPDAPILRADHRCIGFVDVHGAPAASPRRAVAFCGIGNPALFRLDLATAGVEVVSFEARRDHHVWSAVDLAGLVAAAGVEALPLVTTEKDLVRIQDPAVAVVRSPLLALRIEAEVHDPAPLLRALDRVLESRTDA